jgi:hypothetical protein
MGGYCVGPRYSVGPLAYRTPVFALTRPDLPLTLRVPIDAPRHSFHLASSLYDQEFSTVTDAQAKFKEYLRAELREANGHDDHIRH